MAFLLRLTTCVTILMSMQDVVADRYPDCTNGPLVQNDVCRMDVDPAKRAAALVDAMTIGEKLVNLVE
jgi:hypothetical protein